MAQDEFREKVLALHRYLSAWRKGEVPKGDGRPARFADALTDDFVVIHPSGKRGGKADAVRGFAAAARRSSSRTSSTRSSSAAPWHAGFLLLRFSDCGHDKLMAFSCKRRGFCS